MASFPPKTLCTVAPSPSSVHRNVSLGKPRARYKGNLGGFWHSEKQNLSILKCVSSRVQSPGCISGGPRHQGGLKKKDFFRLLMGFHFKSQTCGHNLSLVASLVGAFAEQRSAQLVST